MPVWHAMLASPMARSDGIGALHRSLDGPAVLVHQPVADGVSAGLIELDLLDGGLLGHLIVSFIAEPAVPGPD